MFQWPSLLLEKQALENTKTRGSLASLSQQNWLMRSTRLLHLIHHSLGIYFCPNTNFKLLWNFSWLILWEITIFRKLAVPVILLNELSSVASEVRLARLSSSVFRGVVAPGVEFAGCMLLPISPCGKQSLCSPKRCVLPGSVLQHTEMLCWMTSSAKRWKNPAVYRWDALNSG